MKKFDWQETKDYWRIFSGQFSGIDYDKDPDGLMDVCLVYEPLWYNRLMAKFQRKVYLKLMKLVPAVQPGARALDIGCGAGRWCRLLSESGYQTTGIDLQPQLVESDRKRYPQVKFFNVAAQDFQPEAPFDLISTVTVIQHVPYDEQEVVIRKIRQMLKPGGYVISLENLVDHAVNTHANSIEAWKSKFEKAGFASVAVQRYDYIPLLRLYLWLGSKVYRLLIRRDNNIPESVLTPESLVSAQKQVSSGLDRRERKGLRKIAHQLFNTGKYAAYHLDIVTETVLIAANLPFPTYHCGFVFKAV